MKRTDIEVRITFIEQLLGSSPNNKELYEQYIASKAPDSPNRAKRIQKEIEQIGVGETQDKGTTVFARNRDGDCILNSYVVRGFFKSAQGAFNKVSDKKSREYLSAHKAKIDTCITVTPTGDLDIMDDGLILEVPDGKEDEALDLLQRPLRTSGPTGERVALAASEVLPAGTSFVCVVTVFGDQLLPYVPMWLNYGKVNGIGQWRNSGKGRFKWEELDRRTYDQDMETGKLTPIEG